MLKFRELRADEIECRVQTINEKGCSLLLYKDARCDMNILDETVGPLNWQRHHSRDNANCIVSIWDEEKKQWIEKEDVGTESQTEAVKGLASDSYKRSCFNWGIGRSLYTAPFIWIPCNLVEIRQGKNGKLTTYDKFSVTEFETTDGVIQKLTIVKNDDSEVFRWTRKVKKVKAIPKDKAVKNAVAENPSDSDLEKMHGLISKIYQNDNEVSKLTGIEQGKTIEAAIKRSGINVQEVGNMSLDQLQVMDDVVSWMLKKAMEKVARNE